MNSLDPYKAMRQELKEVLSDLKERSELKFGYF